MGTNQKRPTWPYLTLLLALFALSVSAPRAWQRLSRRAELAPWLISVREQTARQTAGSAKQVQHAGQPRPAPVEQPHHPPVEQPRNAPVEQPHAASPIPRREELRVAMLPRPIAVEEALESRIAAEQGPSTSPATPDSPGTPTAVPTTAPAANSDPTPLADPTDEAAAELGGAEAQSRRWRPVALLAQLVRLEEHPQTQTWATNAAVAIERLLQTLPTPDSALVEQLADLAQHADMLAKGVREPDWNGELLRAARGIERRLPVWRLLATSDKEQSASMVIVSDQNKLALAEALRKVERVLGPAKHGDGWRDYLLLDRLASLTGVAAADEEAARRLTQSALTRLSKAGYVIQWHKFLTTGPLVELAVSLRPFAAEEVDGPQLLAELETFENQRRGVDASRFAERLRWLGYSSQARTFGVASVLDGRYRNANLRFAVSGVLLNRFVPQPNLVESPVRDTILGAQVRGRSLTLSKVSLRLLPDDDRVRLGLEAEGTVASETSSASGPATFYSEGASNFLVRKLFVISPAGIHQWAANAEAENYYNGLKNVETRYDSLPLMGSIVRDIAIDKHDEMRAQARRLTEARVASSARQQLDETIAPRIEKFTQTLEQKIHMPLAKLELAATPVELRTTADRVMVRLRLSGDNQLGSHTPRPRAPSDSLASLQVHDSAINNALDRLELAGRDFALPDLLGHLAARTSRPAVETPSDLPQDVRIRFAAEDPLRVSASDGRIEVVLSVAELRQGDKRWRNFAVRTFYRPESHRLQAQLVRDSGIYLDGPQFKGKPELVLRGIFSKIFSKNRPLTLLDEQLAGDARLADLEITQLEVVDGWLAVAYARHRRSDNMARRTEESKVR